VADIDIAGRCSAGVYNHALLSRSYLCVSSAFLTIKLLVLPLFEDSCAKSGSKRRNSGPNGCHVMRLQFVISEPADPISFAPIRRRGLGVDTGRGPGLCPYPWGR